MHYLGEPTQSYADSQVLYSPRNCQLEESEERNQRRYESIESLDLYKTLLMAPFVGLGYTFLNVPSPHGPYPILTLLRSIALLMTSKARTDTCSGILSSSCYTLMRKVLHVYILIDVQSMGIGY
jgi:hypothetical protein